jgi:hypothetical protein
MSQPRRCYRCAFCSALLPAWLRVVKRPESSMLLYHLGARHLDQVKPYLVRMETEGIDAVLSELYALVEGDG